MKTISSSFVRSSSEKSSSSTQSHALWRYVDDLYGPLNRDIDVSPIRAIVDKKPSTSSNRVPAAGPRSVWRVQYGLDRDSVSSVYPKADSVLRELKGSQRELEIQMERNSKVAIELLKRIEKVTEENKHLKDLKRMSRNTEETYLCRRLAQWNVSKFELEVKEFEERSDPRCHQCGRATSEMKDGNKMISCTQPMSSTCCVRNTGCGLSHVCTKKFCTHCLDKVYQMKLSSTQKKWKCPHCRDACFNFRCLRESRLDILRPRFYDTPSLSKTQSDTLKRATLVLKRLGSVVGLCGVCMKIEPVGQNSNLVQCTGIGCRTFVHPNCARGMNWKQITEKLWLCEVCEKGADTERLRCALCPSNHVPTYYYRKPSSSTSTSSSRNTSPVPTTTTNRGNNGHVSPTLSKGMNGSSNNSSNNLAVVKHRPRRYGIPLLGLPAFTWDSKHERWIHVVCKRWSNHRTQEEERLPKTRNSKREDEELITTCICEQFHDDMVTVCCMYPGCNKRFHPICGLVARPQLYIRHDKNEDFVAYCENHHPLRSMTSDKMRIVGRVLQKHLDEARNLLSLVMRREKQKRNLAHIEMPIWIKELEDEGVADKREVEMMTRVLLQGNNEDNNNNNNKETAKQQRVKKKRRENALHATRFWPTRTRGSTTTNSRLLQSGITNHHRSLDGTGRRFSKNSNTFREPPPYKNYLNGDMYFRVTQSIETAAKLVSQISPQAMRLAKNAPDDCEKGSVEWLLNRRVILWDRTKACFASKQSFAPKMVDLLRHLSSNPEWTVYVGQAPLPPNHELEEDVMMTAIISIHGYITASYVISLSCYSETTQLIHTHTHLQL
jgi:hypothetical protein